MEPHAYTIKLEPMSTNRANMIIMLPVKKGSTKKRPSIIKTKEARRWMDNAINQLVLQRYRHKAQTIEGPVEVVVKVWRAKRIGDVDNFAKGVMDALQGARIIRDDKQVMVLTMHKLHDQANPRYEIELREQARHVALFDAEPASEEAPEAEEILDATEEIPDFFLTDEEKAAKAATQ